MNNIWSNSYDFRKGFRSLWQTLCATLITSHGATYIKFTYAKANNINLIWYLSINEQSLNSPAEQLRDCSFHTAATKIKQITLWMPRGHSVHAANLAAYLLPVPRSSQISIVPQCPLYTKKKTKNQTFQLLISIFNEASETNYSTI